MMQETITSCLAIYEATADGSQEPLHLARWIIPSRGTVAMLDNGDFIDSVEGGKIK
jgi:hypothetical protein